ncbi:MAG: DUF6941 family protein [Phycisphaerae bacterium]
MVADAKPVSLQALLMCDVVAHSERLNSLNIIGIFHAIRMTAFPAAMPHFSVYVAWVGGSPETPLEVRLIDPDGKVITASKPMPPAPLFDSSLPQQSVIVFGGVRVEKPGNHAIQAFAGREYLGEAPLRID